MGSDYKFPQSLSMINFSMIREPSFSVYLNNDDDDGRFEVKRDRAQLSRMGRDQDERAATDDEEIGVFTADKYFNEGLEDKQRPKESLEDRRYAVEGSKGNPVQCVQSPVRSKISLGTPSIRSESSSWHSQTALLHSFPSQVPGRRSVGEMQQRKKSLLSSFICKCSCVTKKSLKVDDDRFNPKESSRHGINQAAQSGTPSLIDKARNSSTNPSPNLLKGTKESSRYSSDSFKPPATGNVRKSISVERKINLLNWDELNPRSEDVHKVSGVSAEYYTDAESDASSDLFEIDSFTGQRKPSFSSQIHDSSASGYATPTTCYAPSEASIDWSVATAIAPVLSDCEEFKHPMPSGYTVTEKHLQKNENSGESLYGYEYHKGDRVLGDMDLHYTSNNTNHHQRIHMDQFVPFSMVQAQAGSRSRWRPPTSSRSRYDYDTSYLK